MNPFLVSDIRHYCNISVKKCTPIPEHIISFFDLTFVLSGSMTYTSSGTQYTLKKNNAILLRPGELRGRLSGTEPTTYVSFNFLLAPEQVLPFATFLPNCISADIRKLISAFPQSHLSTYYHSVEKAASILNYILLELSDITQLGCNNEHVLKMLRYIDAHITEKLSLSSVSHAMNLSREYACSIFKKETGKPITDYINQRKMLMAKELLQGQEMTLTDIATHLGYENYAYFSRLFKRYYDITPVSLKKKSIVS